MAALYLSHSPACACQSEGAGGGACQLAYVTVMFIQCKLQLTPQCKVIDNCSSVIINIGALEALVEDVFSVLYILAAEPQDTTAPSSLLWSC